MVRRRIGLRVGALWRGAKPTTALGLGYASPYLTVLQKAKCLGVLMPEQLGPIAWPERSPNHTVLVQEDRLPVPDSSVDHLLVAHGLEMAEHGRALLREMWRVLSPEGQLLLIVPNRRGMWSRFEHTPFGHGHPYSRGQLDYLLRQSMFTPQRWTSAIYFPPISQRLLLQGATAVERLGAAATPAFAGVLIVEARKEVTAPAGLLQPSRRLRDLVTVRRDQTPS